MRKITIVEDELDIAKNIEFNLKKEGFQTDIITDGKNAFEKIKQNLPTLVILDVMLPNLDGISILRIMKEDKETKKIPVIILTARDSEIDKISGLELGADDYISKPFSIRELIARIKTVLRRYEEKDSYEIIKFKDLIINPQTLEVKLENKKIELTKKEFLLLMELIKARGRILTKEYLLREIWDSPSDIETRTIDVHIMNLRKKIKKYAQRIITVKNTGYRFEIDG